MLRPRHIFGLWWATTLLSTALADEEPRPASHMADKSLAALKAALPQYDPSQKEEPPIWAQEAPLSDVITLPQMTVQEKRLPEFREQDIHTPEGLRQRILKRYTGDIVRAMNTPPFLGPGLMEHSMARWQEDENLRLRQQFEWRAEVDKKIREAMQAKATADSE